MRHQLLIILIAYFCINSGLNAAEFFVDYESGRDAADGKTIKTAFKHCPGDAQAQGRAAQTQLKAGDKVRFKGGVIYRGSITVNSSGTQEAPIILDGNHKGTWGKGRAVIDGSEILTGWKALDEANADNNPHWEKIFWAPLPDGCTSGFSWNIAQGNKLGFISEWKNSDDPWIMKSSNYQSIPSSQGSKTHVKDQALSALHGADLNSAYVAVFCKPNWIYFTPAESLGTDSSTLKFKTHSSIRSFYKNIKYNVMNCLRVIDRPGEYAVDLKAKRVYIMPYSDINESPVTISRRRVGIDIQGVQHVTVQGFTIQKFACGFGQSDGTAVKASSGSAHIKILNNELTMNRSMVKQGVLRMNKTTKCLIADNHVHHNPFYRVLVLDDYNDSEVRGNYLDTNSGTGIVCFRMKNTKIIGNVIKNHVAVHAQAMAVYVKSSDVTIQDNLVEDGVAVTTQDSSNITIHNNVFNSKGRGITIGLWNGGKTTAKITNNTLVGAPDSGWQRGMSIFTNNGSSGTHYEIKNNILEGVSARMPGSVTDNLFLSSNTFGSYSSGNNSKSDKPEQLFKNLKLGDLRPAQEMPQGAVIGEKHGLMLSLNWKQKKISKNIPVKTKIMPKPRLQKAKPAKLDTASLQKALNAQLATSKRGVRFHYSIFKKEVEIRGVDKQGRYKIFVPGMGSTMTVDLFKKIKPKDAKSLSAVLSPKS